MVQSRHITCFHDSSNLKLDFTRLAAYRNTTLILDLSLRSCNCKIYVPAGTEKEEDDVEYQNSVLKIKSKKGEMPGNRLIIRGHLVSSALKIIAKKPGK